MMADILKFTETPLIDESIKEYEYHEYDLITGINLNTLDAKLFFVKLLLAPT